MKERIKELRKKLNLTQEKFAQALGIKRSSYSKYETGENNPTDAVISLICREFNVDEVWLRTGQGEMFRQRTRADDIAAYMGKAFGGRVTPVEEALIAVLARTTPEQWEVIYAKILELHEEIARIKGEGKQEEE